MRNIPITPLESRKQVILRAVVIDYVQTAEPVGSSTLVTRHQLGVKSATVRNELAELSELGYLRQPHTSAGRIPSDMGYRFYVDRLMEDVEMPTAEAAHAKGRLIPRRTEMDVILEQTCRLLSEISHYTSVATHPTVKDTKISHISITRITSRKMLAVMVLDSGRVLYELIELAERSEGIDPVKATNFLMSLLAGRSLESVSAVQSVPDDALEMKELLGKVLKFVRRELENVDEVDVQVEGASYIMQQPEFKDAGRLEAVLSVLEERNVLYKLISSVCVGSEVNVVIGSEIPVNGMHECSFVAAKYRIGGRIVGTIGLVGPTRMDYRRAVSAVEFMSRNLTDLLTDLSVN